MTTQYFADVTYELMKKERREGRNDFFKKEIGSTLAPMPRKTTKLPLGSNQLFPCRSAAPPLPRWLAHTRPLPCYYLQFPCACSLLSFDSPRTLTEQRAAAALDKVEVRDDLVSDVDEEVDPCGPTVAPKWEVRVMWSFADNGGGGEASSYISSVNDRDETAAVNITVAMRISLVLCSAIYVVVSFFDLLFEDTTMTDVLTNFDCSSSVSVPRALNDSMCLSYALHLVLIFPLLFLSLRVNFNELLFSVAGRLPQTRAG